MKCSEIRELLSLYIDNMLEESLIDEVAAHIAACPECKSEYEELIAMTRMLKELPETKLPSDFDRRLHEALSAQTPEAAAENEYQVVKVSKKKWRRKISSICAIFVVGIFVFAMYNNIDQLILVMMRSEWLHLNWKQACRTYITALTMPQAQQMQMKMQRMKLP